METAMNVAISANEKLRAHIIARRAHVGVIGLGYVGAPLALSFNRAGYQVAGFDVNQERVAAINAGEHIINYLGKREIADAVAAGGFVATDDFVRLSEVDVIIICVPTPLTRYNEPDLSYVRATAETIGRHLRHGQLVILESTTWPGTTAEIVKPILDKSGLKCGRDYFLAFSPEREDPGNRNYKTATIPKIVGGEDAVSTQLAAVLYEQAITSVVPVSSSATAEAVKLTENIFRAVNIALVNELKQIYTALGVDIWEVIDAAATKPFGFMPFYPGPGLGGHCIPIDPFYLSWKARECGVETRFIELAGLINTRMPKIIVDRLAQELLQRSERALDGARILVVGLAYKKNVNDIRESPALVIIDLIEERGGACDFHDPFAPHVLKTREHAALSNRKSIDLNAENIARYDAALLVTDHDDLDYALMRDSAKLIIDTRNAFARRELTGDHVVKA